MLSLYFKKICLVLALFTFFTPSVFAAPSHNFYTLTLSILSYSKWIDVKIPTLCIINDNNAADAFASFSEKLNYNYRVINLSLPLNEASKSSCQAIYFSSNVTLVQQRNFISENHLANQLFFSINDSSCEVGSAFCLYKRNDQVTFNINLDALSRSRVHIDPRVLLLAKNSE